MSPLACEDDGLIILRRMGRRCVLMTEIWNTNSTNRQLTRIAFVFVKDHNDGRIATKEEVLDLKQ